LVIGNLHCDINDGDWDHNLVFFWTFTSPRQNALYFYTRCCTPCSRLSRIQRSLWNSLRYPCAQCVCATVGLYALCCNNWYRNNSLSCYCVGFRKNSHACIDCNVEGMAICKRVLYCKKRFSCCTLLLCGSEQLICQQLLSQHCS